MKKKEVIAAVAFEGIPPDAQTEGAMEMGDAILEPMTETNMRLQNAGILRSILSNALPHTHDDEEVTHEQYVILRNALEEFKEMILNATIMPGIRGSIDEEFQGKLAILDDLAERAGK